MSRVVAWGEAEIVESFDSRFLSEPERARLATQASSRRRSEFVAGRLAARRAIAELVGRELELVIDRDDDGAPRLVGVEGVSISITHATRRAIAIAAHGPAPLGLDLCEHRDAARVRRIAARAFPRTHERALVLASDRTACIAWAAKESVAKALRIGMLEGGGVERIEVVSFEPLAVTVDAAPPPLGFEVRDVEEGFVVVAR